MASNTTSSTTQKEVYIPPFDGEVSEWLDWSDRFMGKADIEGYADILEGDTAVPAEFEADGTPRTLSVDEQAVLKRNKLAFAKLKVGLTGTPLAIIRSCKPSSNPRGHAGKAWEALVEAYQPTDMDVEDDFNDLFNSCVPKTPTKPPIAWFQRLDHIVARLATMGEPKSERAVKRHILTKC